MKTYRIASQNLQPRLTPVAADIKRAFATGGLGALLVSVQVAAMAAPTGAQVVGGQATVTQNKDATIVSQGSARAVVNWNTFNVAKGESVTFQQPSSSASILNRVVGGDASTIMGRITANGQVYLVNPNGILFGRTAQVNAGSLVASTANISTLDFMSGRMNFNQPGKPGASVVNEGTITVADGGFVGLVAPSLHNSGVINARLGKVTLAGGDAFTLDLHGDKLINLVVDQTAMQSLTDARGVPLSSYVDQSGTIVAEGGSVTLSVSTAKRLVDNIINVDGVIRATSYDVKPGTIALHGDENAKVTVRGELDASGLRGGTVSATGRDITLSETAKINAGGSASAGGRVFVGGNWQGKGPLLNAQTVDIRRGATIDATGREAGEVAVWSEKSTRFSGTIRNANGKVEVSGKQYLGFDGEVKAASLLLDPTNIVVDLDGYDVQNLGALSGTSAIAASTINRQLALGTEVLLQASSTVTINRTIDGRGGVSGGNLIVDAKDIALNANVFLNNGRFTATATGTFAQADMAALYTGTGAVTIRGDNGIKLNQILSGGDIKLTSVAGSVSVATPLVDFSNAVVGSTGSIEVIGATGVALNGAKAGSGGMLVSSSAGDISTGTAIVDSSGKVTASAARDLIIGTGGIKVSTANDLKLDGVRKVTALGPVATDGGRIDIGSNGDVTMNQVATRLTPAATSGSAFINSAGGNVVLAKPLGGSDTGYLEFNKGYQRTLRPGVGRLTINAPNGSVETNGLNLDGNDSPADKTLGLEIVAGKSLVVNETIAVNKGDINLQSKGTAEGDGIYIGNNIYSRGHDLYSESLPVRTNEVGKYLNNNKTAYAINLKSEKNIGLFDNTNEQADFTLISARRANDPSYPKEFYDHSIAKIIISNNVANYSDSGNGSALVAINSPTPVIALSGKLIGVDVLPNTPLRVSSLNVQPVAMTDVRNRTFDPDAKAEKDGQGISLKVLAYATSGDASTKVEWNTCKVHPCMLFNNGTPYEFRYEVDDFQNSTVVSSNDRPSNPGKTLGVDFSGLQFSSGSIAPVVVPDTSALPSSGHEVSRPEGKPIPEEDYRNLRNVPNVNEQPPYAISNSFIQSSSIAGESGTRTLIYDGVIKKSEGNVTSDALGYKNDVDPNLALMNNSSTSFAAIGGFAPIPSLNSSLLTANTGSTQGFVTPLPSTTPPNATTAPNPTTPGTTVTTPISNPPANSDPSGSVANGSQESPGPSNTELGFEREAQENQMLVDDNAGIGTRAAADADLGRGSSLGGRSRNVFGTRYKLASTADSTICAPADIELTKEQSGAPGGNDRDCK